jgi:methylglutaconyl-CoA hydratase
MSAGPNAAQEAKALVAASRGQVPEDLRDMTADWIAGLRTSAEGQEGLGAFLDRRKPSWLQ